MSWSRMMAARIGENGADRRCVLQVESAGGGDELDVRDEGEGSGKDNCRVEPGHEQPSGQWCIY